MRKWLVITVAAALAAVIVILIFVRAGQKRAKAQEFAAKVEVKAAVEVVRARVGAIEEAQPFLAKVVSTNQALVYSKIPGKVVALPVKVGTRVGAGGTIAVVDYDQPGMKFRYYDAYSPIAGEVAQVMVNVGDMVAPTTPLAAVVKPESVKIQMQVPADVLAKLRRGQPVAIHVHGSEETTVDGEIANLPASLSPDTHMALVEIRPLGTLGGLRSGMFAEVMVPTARNDRAVLVPPEAVRREAGGNAVYVVAGDAMRRRPVKVGLATEDAVEIVSGVRSGDEVVVVANRDLEDGVKIVKKEPYRAHR